MRAILENIYYSLYLLYEERVKYNRNKLIICIIIMKECDIIDEDFFNNQPMNKSEVLIKLQYYI